MQSFKVSLVYTRKAAKADGHDRHGWGCIRHQDQRRQGALGKTKRSNNRVRQALKMAAMSLAHGESALGAFYRRMCTRMDKPSANMAVAHKLARMVYFMMTRP